VSIPVVTGRYTENTEPMSDIFKNRYRRRYLEYRQLNTEKIGSVRYFISLFHQSVA